jgi:hypothetical protein
LSCKFQAGAAAHLLHDVWVERQLVEHPRDGTAAGVIAYSKYTQDRLAAQQQQQHSSRRNCVRWCWRSQRADVAAHKAHSCVCLNGETWRANLTT